MLNSVKVTSAASPPLEHLRDADPSQLEAASTGIGTGFKHSSESDYKLAGSEFVPVYNQQSLHPVGKDPWWVAGFHFVVALNNILVLGYPYLILAPLGWYAGTSLWIGGMFFGYYCNCLLASLHEYKGIRHIRHRDLAHHIYGRLMYKIVFFLQYFNLYVGDIGLIIIGGQTLKAIYLNYDYDGRIELAYWIAIAGTAFLAVAICIPHLHALGLVSAVSLASTATYGGISMVIAIQNGLDSPPRDYNVYGTRTTKVFNAIAAVLSIGYSFNTTILPEIQSTVKAPAVENMYKALKMQICVSNPIFMTLAFVSYWAYGSAVEPVLLASLRGPKTWITIANAAACIQACMSLHLYATPIYEYVDTKFGRPEEGDWSLVNIGVRIVGRSAYMISSTFLGALLPLFGDFLVITAATCVWPLEFVLANHMYLTVKKELGKLQRWWHWVLVVLTTLFSLTATVAAIRYLIIDSINYKAFANI